VTAVHAGLGFAAVTLFAAAALLGAWRWRAREASPTFWRLLRAGQAVLVADAAAGGALLLAGRATGDLHLLYGLLPLGVLFAAEGMRAAAAATVLEAEGHESPAAVGRLAPDEQRAVVTAILRRELGVMAVAAAVAAALALRAGFEFGSL
jgi:hypothetical protein